MVSQSQLDQVVFLRQFGVWSVLGEEFLSLRCSERLANNYSERSRMEVRVYEEAEFVGLALFLMFSRNPWWSG